MAGFLFRTHIAPLAVMMAEIIDLAKERARRRPDLEPVLPLPAAVPLLWDYEDIVDLFRYLEAQIG